MEWWDFVNYHYYNAWAFLNDRLGIDIIPAFINTFFSPFIELPSYFLVNALNNHPVIFSTIMAVPYGLLLFVAYKTAALFFSSDTKRGRIMIGLTLLLSICSVPVFMELCGTTHEHPMAFLSLAALYLLLKKVPSRQLDTKTCLISGFILGAVAGLKMTYCLYAAATGISLLLFAGNFDRPIKSIALFTLAGIAGFLVTYGYWGWVLWKNFENPFFPFLNSIFHSPYWNEEEYRDIRYFNLPWLNVIFYPFHLFLFIGGDFSMHHHFILSHLRIIIGMILFIAEFCSYVKDRLNHKEKNPADDLIHFVMMWMTVTYVLWLGIFRVYRYMIPFELMLSIVLVHFFFRKETFSLKNFSFAVRLALFLSFCAFVGNECMHLAYSRSATQPILPTNIKIEPVPDDTLLLLDFVPGSMFIPFLVPNSTVRVALSPRMKFSVNGSAFHSTGYFAKKRDQLIKEHKEQGKPIAYIVGRSFYFFKKGLDKTCSYLGPVFGSDYYIRYFLCPYAP